VTRFLADAMLGRLAPICDRVYWRGSHARRMEAALATAFAE
jgi:uncharacterized protein with PIN domain